MVFVFLKHLTLPDRLRIASISMFSGCRDHQQVSSIGRGDADHKGSSSADRGASSTAIIETAAALNAFAL